MRIHTCVHRKKQVIALCVSLRAAQGVFYYSFPSSLYGFPSFFPISRFPGPFRFSFQYPDFPDHSGFSFRYLGFPRIIPVFLFKVLLVPPGGVRPAHRSRGRSYPRERVHLPFWGQRPDKKELCGTGFSNGNPDPLEHIH